MKHTTYLLTTLLLFTLLAACAPVQPNAAAPEGTSTPEMAAEGSDCEEGSRPFEHFAGVTCVPEDPQRAVTVRDQHGLFPLWQLGFRNIVGSVGSIDENGDPYFRRMEAHGYDPSGVEWIGQYGEPDLEAIVALNPDLIVGARTDEDIYDQLSSIAPTVLMDPWSDKPLSEIVMAYAEVVGLEEEAQRLEAEYQASLETLREAAGDPSEIVISVIGTAAAGGAEPGQFFTIGGAMQRVLTEVGFARPAAQVNPDGRVYFSVERLREHDGDLLLRMTTRQEAGEEDENTEAIRGSPLWDQLNAVQKGHAFDANGEATVGGGYAPYLKVTELLMDLLQAFDTSGDLSHVEIATPEGS